MNTKLDISLTNWKAVKKLVRQRWGRITDDDLDLIGGKSDELISILRKRYGYGKTQAEIEIDDWLSSVNHVGVSPK